MATVESIKRLRIEVTETGAVETQRQLRTLTDAMVGAQKASEQFVRQQEALVRQEAAQRSAFASAAAGIGTVGRAFRDVGDVIKDHPVLVTAGALASARALGTISPALMAASVATKTLANDNAILAASAGVASRGLAAGATATAAAAASAKTFAESLSPAVLATRLLGKAAGVALPYLAPIALGLTGIKVGADVIGKASADLEKLIALGERAEKLDIGAPFLKSFTGLSKQLRLEVTDMEQVLATASGAVRDKFGQPNALTSSLSTLYSGGFTNGNPLAASGMAETAKTTEERIRAAAVAMAELEGLGQKFAALDIAEKFFGPAVAERLRTGQVTAAQMAADLEQASRTELLKAEDVARAVELSRNISDVKKEIGAAVSTTFDFSAAAMAVDGAWLRILRTTRDVVVAMNQVIAGAPAAAEAYNKTLDAGAAQRKRDQAQAAVDQASQYTGPSAAVVQAQAAARLQRASQGVAEANLILDPAEAAREHNRAVGLSRLPAEKPIGAVVTPEYFGPAIPKGEPAARAGRAARAEPRGESLDGMDRYIRDIEKARDVAEAEYRTIGLGNQARERALDLAKAQSAAQTDFQRGLRDSAALTSDETARIIAAADATVRWKDAAKEVQDAINFSSDATKDFAKSFAHDMQAGKSAAEALHNSLNALATKLMDKSLDMAVDGLFGRTGAGGGVAGFIASLAGRGLTSAFGGGGSPTMAQGGFGPDIPAGIGQNAMGTDNWRGGPTWINERGPEIVDLPQGSRVYPNGTTPPANGNVTHNVTFQVSLEGAQGNTEVAAIASQAVNRGLAAYSNELGRGGGINRLLGAAKGR